MSRVISNPALSLALTLHSRFSIDLSPFHFPQDPAHIFIGSKTTSLIGLDLQTGQNVGTFGTNRSTPLGVCKPDGEGLQGVDDEECESDIDDRPEDLLYIGQTGM